MHEPNETRRSDVPQMAAKASITPCSWRMSQHSCSCATPYRLNSPP